jgi:hypothetical protein
MGRNVRELAYFAFSADGPFADKGNFSKANWFSYLIKTIVYF